MEKSSFQALEAAANQELFTLAHLTRRPDGPAPDTGEEPEERYSLVLLKLHTGRTHQIRVLGGLEKRQESVEKGGCWLKKMS